MNDPVANINISTRCRKNSPLKDKYVVRYVVVVAGCHKLYTAAENTANLKKKKLNKVFVAKHICHKNLNDC